MVVRGLGRDELTLKEVELAFFASRDTPSGNAQGTTKSPSADVAAIERGVAPSISGASAASRRSVTEAVRRQREREEEVLRAQIKEKNRRIQKGTAASRQCVGTSTPLSTVRICSPHCSRNEGHRVPSSLLCVDSLG